MDQFTRRIIGFGVHVGAVDGVALCRMFNKAISGMGVPKYLSTDNDPLFTYHRWQANLRILEIDEIRTVPYVPLSHPFVERLIGTIRRECLDQMFFWNAIDLEKKLEAFRDYFNDPRVHTSLDGHTPAAASADTIETCASRKGVSSEFLDDSARIDQSLRHDSAAPLRRRSVHLQRAFSSVLAA